MDQGLERRVLLRAVRGSPATVILAMLWFPGLRGEEEIGGACGLSARTVRRALGALEGLGLAWRGRRYGGWMLGPGVRQMVLGEEVERGDGGCLTATLEGRERNIVPLPGGSSSYIEESSVLVCLDPETTTTERERNILPLEAGGAAVEALIRMGCSPSLASASVGEAQARGGGSEGAVMARVVGWRAYCEGQRSIRAPGHLAARRVAAGIDAPGAGPVTRDDESWGYIQDRLGEIVKH